MIFYIDDMCEGFAKQYYVQLVYHVCDSYYWFELWVWGYEDDILTRKIWLEIQYRKTSNISRTSVGDEIVDNSDVVGASPVGAAQTTSSFST